MTITGKIQESGAGESDGLWDSAPLSWWFVCCVLLSPLVLRRMPLGSCFDLLLHIRHWYKILVGGKVLRLKIRVGKSYLYRDWPEKVTTLVW